MDLPMRPRIPLLFALSVMLAVAGDARAQLTQDNYRDAIIGMMSAGNQAQQIGNLREVSSLSIVNLRRIVVFRHPGDEPDRASLGLSAQKNAAGIGRLRAALASNPATRNALAARGVSLGRVVAARILAGNSLRVY